MKINSQMLSGCVCAVVAAAGLLLCAAAPASAGGFQPLASPPITPEPGTVALFASVAISGIGIAVRRNRRSK